MIIAGHNFTPIHAHGISDQYVRAEMRYLKIVEVLETVPPNTHITLGQFQKLLGLASAVTASQYLKNLVNNGRLLRHQTGESAFSPTTYSLPSVDPAIAPSRSHYFSGPPRISLRQKADVNRLIRHFKTKNKSNDLTDFANWIRSAK